jgi:hypothetical protein
MTWHINVLKNNNNKNKNLTQKLLWSIWASRSNVYIGYKIKGWAIWALRSISIQLLKMHTPTNLLKYVISYVHVTVWKRDRSSSTVLRFRQFFSCNNLFTMDVVFIGRVSLPTPFYLFFGYFGITVEIIACCLYFYFYFFAFFV